ncbi:hypothetical protein CONLIGDRAFT_287779 [Coniochaeta ligniaria NRRL 30616]|uniref:Uncharacterized protein n=1 Tax=Coniochaeta ligniaria NRRL 30616 TaxID=1408157 RepID=A0A1J7IU30_9PEZI|nr:hypothetical protein CONLIGDRAFT_287779 [Coniochaeta ligniaria NRRL 30616]
MGAQYRPTGPRTKSDAASDNILVERSRPIPIAYAKPKSPALIEPVSARGDLAVAYFPMHEKEGDRAHIYQPHPFGQEVKRARQRSISEAEASAAGQAEAHSITSNSTGPAAYAGQSARAASAVRIAGDDKPPAAGLKQRADPTWRARTAPIVEAYNPTGIPGSAASLGKYYPTNYEASDAADSAARLPRPASELSFSLSRKDQAHRLRQYQRDMISQTLQKAREALGRTMQSTTSTKVAETVLDEDSRKSVASGFALLRRYKPLSPRITPLLSPGPVTPMALDGDGEPDYITVREARPR